MNAFGRIIKGGSMTKSELVKLAANASGVTIKQAGDVLDAIIGGIEGASRVEIRGFGVFKTVTRKARTCHNPATGGTVEVPAKKVLTFKQSKGK